jgi:hypothetical protein
LLSIDTLRYDDLGLADISKGINDSLLLEFFKSSLVRAEQEYYWEAIAIMERIVDLTDDAALTDILKKMMDLRFTDDNNAKEMMKKMFAAFTTRMKAAGLKSRVDATGTNNTSSPALVLIPQFVKQ